MKDFSWQSSESYKTRSERLTLLLLFAAAVTLVNLGCRPMIAYRYINPRSYAGTANMSSCCCCSCVGNLHKDFRPSLLLLRSGTKRKQVINKDPVPYIIPSVHHLQSKSRIGSTKLSNFQTSYLFTGWTMHLWHTDQFLFKVSNDRLCFDIKH